MEEDIKTVSLQALEDLTSRSSFGHAGLHSVSERPLIRDRKNRTVATRRGKTAVTLRRHSLMNERTRISRPSDSSDEKRTHGRHSYMRKRKSDELGSIDLSELDGFETNNTEMKPTTISPPKSTFDNFGDVFFDMNSRWQQAFQLEKGRQDEGDEIPMHHLSEASSIFSTPRKEIISPYPKEEEPKIIPDIRSITNTAPTPETPLFRHFRHQSLSSHESESPCSVAALTRGCGACFWERSLAWSEDDDDDTDDGIVHPVQNHQSKIIREHLSVPKHLGKEFAETQEVRKSRPRTTHIRRPSSSRTITLETDSRHKMPGAKMFRQTDVDKVTEIHWEEKVLDTTALEMMAKLSL